MGYDRSFHQDDIDVRRSYKCIRHLVHAVLSEAPCYAEANAAAAVRKTGIAQDQGCISVSITLYELADECNGYCNRLRDRKCLTEGLSNRLYKTACHSPYPKLAIRYTSSI